MPKAQRGKRLAEHFLNVRLGPYLCDFQTPLTAAAQAASREKKRETRRILEIERRSFANFLRNGLTVLSLRGSVGADTKQPYRGALLTK